MLPDRRQRPALRPALAIALLTICVSLPFLGKPFNIDDPLFIWTAHHIQSHPFDPFGFKVAWGWGYGPMWLMTDNPPLTSYFIAVAALAVGWSEVALHLVFLLPTLTVVLGTVRLARLFSAPPAMAAVATLFTPAFLVSSTTVMSDVPMLALWVWAIVLWMEATEENHFLKFAAAALLIAMAELTKYYGMCLIPLLAAYTVAAKRGIRRELLFLVVPVAVLCVYQFLTSRLYGMNLVFDVANFSIGKSLGSRVYGDSFLTALVFVGGCFAVVVFLAPLLWKKRPLVVGAVMLLAAGAAFFHTSLLPKYFVSLGFRGFYRAQLAVWAAAGASVLALTVSEMLSRRDAKSIMLLLWVFGTFVFAAFCNWTINARTILPMAPALGVLIAQRLQRNFHGASIPKLFFGICIVASGVFALYVTEADSLLAFAAKQNAQSIHQDYGAKFRQVHFEGHWGFQYYMSQSGAWPLIFKNTTLKPGDLVAIPSNNTNLLPLAPGKGVLLQIYSEPGPPLVTTVSSTLGAGFYASLIGSLPFVFGPVPRETVAIYSLR